VVGCERRRGGGSRRDVGGGGRATWGEGGQGKEGGRWGDGGQGEEEALGRRRRPGGKPQGAAVRGRQCDRNRTGPLLNRLRSGPVVEAGAAWSLLQTTVDPLSQGQFMALKLVASRL